MLKENCKQLKGLPEQRVAFEVNKNYHSSNVRYYNMSYKEVVSSAQDCCYMWVDSGFKNNDGNNLFLQFSLSAFGWQGAWVGTEDEITLNQVGKTLLELSAYKVELPEGVNLIFEENDEQDILSKVDPIENQKSRGMVNSLSNPMTQRFYSDLYNRLLIQKGWDLNTNALRMYIEILITRINHCLCKGGDCSKFLTYNKDKTAVIFNSALLDKFGKTITIVNTLREVKNGKKKKLSLLQLKIVDSKSMLLELGFSKDSINTSIERVPFHNKNISELVFNASIEDFDLEDWSRLSHCILDRRERFPEEYANDSTEALCADMLRSIELGIKLSKYDSNYVKPIYSPRRDSIHFVMPYHVGNNFTESPQLGIVVSRGSSSDLWKVMTIIDYEMATQDTRVLSLYSDNSF